MATEEINQAMASEMASTMEPQPGKFQEYTDLKFIGKGSNGQVYATTREKDGMKVAVKFIPKRSLRKVKLSDDLTLPREVFFLHCVGKIPGCIRILDNFPVDGAHVIVMERPNDAVDLEEYAKNNPLPEWEIRVLFRQCVETVQELHKLGVIHQDIKPNNMLIERATHKLKIIDFGSATAVQDDNFTAFKGPKLFAPPEFLKNKAFQGVPGTVWTLGITLYYLSHGVLPYKNEEDILSGSLYGDCSEPLRDLMLSMFSHDPSKRPDFTSILQHPWMSMELQESSVQESK